MSRMESVRDGKSQVGLASVDGTNISLGHWSGRRWNQLPQHRTEKSADVYSFSMELGF